MLIDSKGIYNIFAGKSFYKMKIIHKTLLVFVLAFVSSKLSAQGPPPPPPPPGLPIDSGIFLLLLAAVGYGYKKLKN